MVEIHGLHVRCMFVTWVHWPLTAAGWAWVGLLVICTAAVSTAALQLRDRICDKNGINNPRFTCTTSNHVHAWLVRVLLTYNHHLLDQKLTSMCVSPAFNY
jgi:hypothetical protein